MPQGAVRVRSPVKTRRFNRTPTSCQSVPAASGGDWQLTGCMGRTDGAGTVCGVNNALTYRVLRRLTGAAVRCFYRVSVYRHGEHAAGSTPMVVIANHPNGGVDPVVVASVVSSPLHFLAKSSLFHAPVLGTVLRLIGALPAFRRQDGHDTTKNAATFASTRSVLQQRGAVCVFPEGTSHSDPQLRQLRTGAARIALDAALSDAPDTVIVPVGLLYRERERFRSEASVNVGSPLVVRDWVEAQGVDPDTVDSGDATLVRALTSAAEAALDAVSFTAADTTLLALAEHLAAAGGTDKASNPANLCRWAAVLDEASTTEHGRQLIEELRAFFELLNESGMTAGDLAGEHLSCEVGPLLGDAAWSALLVPAAAVGSAAGAVPFHAVHAVYSVAGKRGVGAAAVKVVAGVVLYPAWAWVSYRWLRRKKVGAAWAGVILAVGWSSHLAARPIWEDQGRRWRRHLLGLRLRRSARLRDRRSEAQHSFAELLSRLEALTI
jgi:1-acyl-sn-glycerol-3-phosphate acyltransferase